MKFLKIPFQYEPEVPDDYTEEGVEKGAKISDGGVDTPDVLRIVKETEALPLAEALDWMEAHRREFHYTTALIDTDDGNEIAAKYGKTRTRVFVQKRSLNLIRHLNTLLNRANETL